MKIFYLFFLIIFVFNFKVKPDQINGLGENMKEICPYETFEAKCGKEDEVIKIKQALYGRMKHGRCIKETYDLVGCHGDVTDIADTRCSGRRTCKIKVQDEEMDGRTTCREDLKTFLIISYHCWKVHIPHTNDNCTISSSLSSSSSNQFKSLTKTQKEKSSKVENNFKNHVLLSSEAIHNKTKCGLIHKPWKIYRRKNEKIKIFLLDYSGIKRNESYLKCHIMVQIRETPSSHLLHVCAGDKPDHFSDVPNFETPSRHSFYSFGSSSSFSLALEDLEPDPVELNTNLLKNMGQYLVKIVFTCADPPPLQGFIWNRNQDNGTFTCIKTGKLFNWSCEGSTWKNLETVSNMQSSCGDGYFYEEASFSSLPYLPKSHVIAIILVIMIAALVGVIIFCCGYCLIKKKPNNMLMQERQEQQQQQQFKQLTYQQQDMVNKEFKYNDNFIEQQKKLFAQQQTQQYQQQQLLHQHLAGEENEYAYVEDLQPVKEFQSRNNISEEYGDNNDINNMNNLNNLNHNNNDEGLSKNINNDFSPYNQQTLLKTTTTFQPQSLSQPSPHLFHSKVQNNSCINSPLS